MYMRTFSLASCSVFALVACAPESSAPKGEAVECALSGTQNFAKECVLERLSGDAFAIHSPDGGFHRFTYNAATGTLSVSDGAEGIAVQPPLSNGRTEFAVGADRYRINLETLASAAK